MGLFDRMLGKKNDPRAAANPPAAEPPPAEPADEAAKPAMPEGNVLPRLVEAREKLEGQDLPGAVAIYEEVLTAAGERADVLVTISGDLGVNGHLREIIELVAPRYDADRHGPAAGLNILQAYLALRNAEAAQHLLDILFALKRPELEERLHGFSNAIADLIHQDLAPLDAGPGPEAGPVERKINIVSISKPIWYYGLEAVPDLLPAKPDRLRRVAFVQLALPGLADLGELTVRPEEELGRLSRALPLWLAEAFCFSPHYAPIAALGVMNAPGDPGHYALFPAEWTTDNLRQLVDTTDGGLDYIITGALRRQAGDYEVILRVWEVRKFRERKQFTARWAPATADPELARLHEQVRTFMEWSADPSALAYVPPAAPRAWLDVLGASVSLFLAGKAILAKEQLPDLTGDLATAAAQAAGGESASLACLTLAQRTRQLGLPLTPPPAILAASPRVTAAQAAVAG